MTMGEKGNYILAVLKTTEYYENLKESLRDLRNEMQSLTNITVNNRTYNIECFLGDTGSFWPVFVALELQTQDYACIWWKCLRLER